MDDKRLGVAIELLESSNHVSNLDYEVAAPEDDLLQLALLRGNFVAGGKQLAECLFKDRVVREVTIEDELAQARQWLHQLDPRATLRLFDTFR